MIVDGLAEDEEDMKGRKGGYDSFMVSNVVPIPGRKAKHVAYIVYASICHAIEQCR